MKKCFALFCVIYCVALTAIGQTRGPIKEIPQQKVTADSLLINKLSHTYKTHPKSILDVLITSKQTLEDIGFGYSEVSNVYESGDFWIKYHFVFLKDSLISYKLEAVVLYDGELAVRYKKICSPLFRFKTKMRSEPIYFNYNAMITPLSDTIKTASKSKEIQFLMTPFSGTTYGYYAITGYVLMLLDNRSAFNAVKDNITPEIDYMLLFSKNPATRLCAVEYYDKNPNMFLPATRQKFEKRIADIYKDMPIITTKIGGVQTNQHADEMVKLALKTEF